jgi:signal transduction histidine kinase
VVEESLGVVAHPLKRRGIVVQADIDPELRVFCDEALMKQVFINLFLNASQAMPQGGELGIGASRSGMETGWMWEMIVRDTGCGIEEASHQRIFDPFFTTREQGTGLGLTIVHNILQAHGGSIVVDSRVKPGCSFILRIPDRGEECRDLRS